MRPNFPLLTSRLLLRSFERGDLNDLFAYPSQADVSRYLYSEPLADPSGAEQDLLHRIASDQLTQEHETMVLAVVWPEAKRVIGGVMPHYSSQADKQGEIGYVFNPEYRGQRFATEAVQVMLEIGFQGLEMHRIVGRCDNGPEFVAAALRDWCRFCGTGTSYIDPGSPWQNPFVESFNGKARDELFAREIFDSILEAQVLYEDWRHTYTLHRPHRALNNQPAAVFAAAVNNQTLSPALDLDPLLGAPSLALARVPDTQREPPLR